MKHGRSDKYKKLQAKFDKKYSEAAERYLINNVTELKSINPGKAYKLLRRMGGGAENEGDFKLQNHCEEKTTMTTSNRHMMSANLVYIGHI